MFSGEEGSAGKTPCGTHYTPNSSSPGGRQGSGWGSYLRGGGKVGGGVPKDPKPAHESRSVPLAICKTRL